MKPSVSAAYLLVVIIWSTTPLGIVWSSESVHPTMAVLLRMSIAVSLGLVVIFVRKIEFPKTPSAIRLYCYSGMGVFAGMLFSYLSARYLASGTISLIFGLSPIISGLLATRILGEARFTFIRKIALTIALSGLAVVCSDGVAFNSQSWPGLIFILIAVSFFSWSSVLVKSVNITINPISTTVGALLVSLPFFIIAWLLMDGTMPISEWQARSIGAIVYLGVFGSLIGFIAYYYILQKLTASTVALVTLMTPVFAMFLGASLNNEAFTVKLTVGALLVLIGLGLFLFGNRLKMSKHTKIRLP